MQHTGKFEGGVFLGTRTVWVLVWELGNMTFRG
jgi:hypothetical protein